MGNFLWQRMDVPCDIGKFGYFVLILGGACYRIKGFARPVDDDLLLIAYLSGYIL